MTCKFKRAPQLPQYFVAGGLSKPQAEHLPLGAVTRAGGCRFSPQLVQKRMSCAFLVPHFGHSFNSMLAPQLLQNLPVPAGSPQEGQMGAALAAVAGGAAWAGGCKFSPQLVQKRTAWAFFVPHFGHSLNSMLAPQLLQNLPVPAGLPQEWQMVVLLSMAPFHTVADCPASSMFLFNA